MSSDNTRNGPPTDEEDWQAARIIAGPGATAAEVSEMYDVIKDEQARLKREGKWW